MALKIDKNTFEEAKELVKEGDTDLTAVRREYEQLTGRPTNVDDDALTVASWTVDDDPEERVARIKQIELEGYEITA